jgi:erythromycin esterase
MFMPVPGLAIPSTATVLLLAVLSFPHASPPESDAGGEVGIEVGPGLYRLHGSDPELPVDDLEALRLVVGNAQLVGLGESIHTNGGYYQMKHRLFRYLVGEGFRAFGFESPWVPAELAREYVDTCAGSSDDAVDSLIFRVWNCSEVRDLLEWMCDWNQLHPEDPVHFYGFDVQNYGDGNTAPLVEFLEELGYEEVDSIVEGILLCDGAEVTYPERGYPKACYERCQEALAAAGELFDEEEARIVRATSREDLAWARVHLVSAQTLQESIFYYHTDPARAYSARDRGMAAVAAAIREIRFPHARVALWAHNAHVMKNAPESSYALENMGTFLDEEFGQQYAAIALTAYEFYLEWFDNGLCGGPYSYDGDIALEALLHRTGEAALLADFVQQRGDESFLEPGADYSIGGITGVPARHFDGLVYMANSPAMETLYTYGVCP